MSVRFILGRAGSGKTWHLLDQIEQLHRADPLGPPIFWLLPKQATFQTERALTVALGAFSRVRIVSFDLLGKDILTSCGDVGIPEVTAIGRRMVIALLLRKHREKLKFYELSAHRPGLATELDATFGEFERAGLDTPSLEDLLQKIEPDPFAGASLLDKLRDVHLLHSEYNKYIGQDRLDPARRLKRILKRVSDCSLLRDAVLFVDDFYDFTAYERQLLTALAGVVQRTEISLLLDPTSEAVTHPALMLNDLSVFHRTERTYQSLLNSCRDAGVRVDQPLLLDGSRRSQISELNAIEQHLFEPTADAAGPALSSTSEAGVFAIEWFDAPDTRIEIDGIARRIRRCLSDGMRYRDIAVLVRNLGDYQEIIAASFAEHGLPYFADHRRSAGHHPLLQMVRACLLIARHRWPHEAVMSLIKTGLAGVTDSEADELENYVLQHRIRGRMWESTEPWNFKRELTLVSEDGESAQPELTQTARIDALRRGLVEKLSPLLKLKTGEGIAGFTVRQLATALFSVLDAFEVRGRLMQWMSTAEAAGDLEQRGEHEQVWSEFSDLFQHLVELLGDEPTTLADFISILDSGLESFDLALTPPTVDQIVVGQVDRTRTPSVKIVFVAGLAEGMFPRAVSEKCVLSDNERRALRRRNIDLDPDSERRLLDERFLAYLAFTRPSQRLILSRPLAAQNGRVTNPSSFWIELQRLFPDAPVQHLARPSQSEAESIGTPRQLVSALLRWVRSNDLSPATDWPALYQWLNNQKPEINSSPPDLFPDAVRWLRDRVWSALQYANSSAIEVELARSLFPMPLQATVAQLETMAACPFRHFARYGLKLHRRDDADITQIDLSNAYHDVLTNLVNDTLSTRQDWCSLPPDKCQELIRTHTAEIGRRLRGELMLSTARNRYILNRIERTLEQSVATMTEMHRRGKYRPGHAGLRFGPHGKLQAHSMPTPTGGEVHLSGRIDRVDLHQKAGAFTVSDYKFYASPLRLDRVFHGLSLQLLTYLLVVQANGQELAGRKLTPAAAFLVQLLRTPQTIDHPSRSKDPMDPDFHLRVRPRGVIESRAVPSLDANLQGGQSNVVQVYVNKDGAFGKNNASDTATPEEFTALLKHVQKRIGELADQVVRGDVAVEPYMIGDTTPCSHCEYRSVCRFEPGINHYRILTPMKREEVLEQLIMEK
jgi:ATP-dependent helicase/nuclease subunit B